MKLLSLISLLLGLHILFVGCDRLRRPGTAKIRRQSTSTSKLSDSDLESAVRAKLANDALLREEANVRVLADANRNEITLAGTVRSSTAREKAIELAKKAKPGVLLNDQMEVKPAN